MTHEALMVGEPEITEVPDSRQPRIRVSAFVADTVARVSPRATLPELADALVAADVGALVVGDGDVVDAVVSERDIVRAVAARRDLTTTTAIDIATTKLIWCDADSTVAEVAMEMMDQYVRHVLVEENGSLVGIVSARDLLGAYAATDIEVTPQDW
jgi:CBS domain-containing protein